MSINLALNDYRILEVLDKIGLNEFKEFIIESKNIIQVDKEIHQNFNDYPESLQESIKNLDSKFESVKYIVRNINDDIQAGTIKVFEDSVFPGEMLFDAESFKKQFHHYALEQGIDDSYIHLQPYGKYHIELDDHHSDIHLNTLIKNGGINEVMTQIENELAFSKLLRVADYQRNYQNHHDKTYKKYIDVKKFQDATGYVLSSEIKNGQRPQDDEMIRIYNKYERIVPLMDEIRTIINE